MPEEVVKPISPPSGARLQTEEAPRPGPEGENHFLAQASGDFPELSTLGQRFSGPPSRIATDQAKGNGTIPVVAFNNISSNFLSQVKAAEQALPQPIRDLIAGGGIRIIATPTLDDTIRGFAGLPPDVAEGVGDGGARYLPESRAVLIAEY